MPHSPPSRALPASGLVAAASLLLTGCLSGPVAEPEAWTPPPVVEPSSTGFFLVELDNRLLAWQRLKLEAASKSDHRKLRGIERELTQQTAKRQDELLDELASHSPKNRAIAAISLGFTGDPLVVGPMLAALGDSDALVRNNALVGLGVLGDANTPLAQICYLLQTDPDPWTRNNAAFAIQAVVVGGGTDECALTSCREALVDLEPGVRAQSASVLGLLADSESVEDLGDLLYDEVRLVSAASAAALANIGRLDLTVKGKVARALVDALDRVDEDHQNHILVELVRLADLSYGDDFEAWTEWAYKMP